MKKRKKIYVYVKKKILECLGKLGIFEYNFLIICFYILISIILKHLFNINILAYNSNLHIFLKESISWLISIVFGGIVFSTVALSVLANLKSKNVSYLKVFLYGKRALGSKRGFFESNMPFVQSLYMIIFLIIMLFISYYIKSDGISVALITYIYFLLFSIIEFSFSSFDINNENFYLDYDIRNYIIKKTMIDIKKSKTIYIKEYIDFDVDLLISISDDIVKKKYIIYAEFKADLALFEKNIDYIIEKRIFKKFICFYNIYFYINVIENKKEYYLDNASKEEIDKMKIRIDTIFRYINGEYEKYDSLSSYYELLPKIEKIKKVFNHR